MRARTGRREARKDTCRGGEWSPRSRRGFLSQDLTRPIPIAEAVEDWLETYRPTLSRSYEATARSLVHRHLIPFFGSQDIRDFAAPDVLRFAEQKLESGLSLSSVKNALTIVRRVLNLHVEQGVLARNPLPGLGRLLDDVADRYEKEARQPDSWTAHEAETLLRNCNKIT